MILWIDTETTGLSPTMDDMLELGMIITRDDLTFVEGKSMLIQPGNFSFSKMNPLVRDMHIKSGLIADLTPGSTKKVYPLDRVERSFIAWLEANMMLGRPMAGSSVQFDRQMLERHMPHLASKFHYRNMDVSSLREFSRAWWENHDFWQEKLLGAENTHRVIPDLHDTIELARFYKDGLFKMPGLIDFALTSVTGIKIPKEEQS